MWSPSLLVRNQDISVQIGKCWYINYTNGAKTNNIVNQVTYEFIDEGVCPYSGHSVKIEDSRG